MLHKMNASTVTCRVLTVGLDAGHVRRKSRRWRIKDDCPENRILTRHFRKVVAQIVGNSWVHYGYATSAPRFKSLPPASKCASFESCDSMKRIDFLEHPADVYDKLATHVEKLVMHHSGRPTGDAERHLWGLSALEWKQEEAALIEADDSDEDVSG
jgi:hypothetical protein